MVLLFWLTLYRLRRYKIETFIVTWLNRCCSHKVCAIYHLPVHMLEYAHANRQKEHCQWCSGPRQTCIRRCYTIRQCYAPATDIDSLMNDASHLVFDPIEVIDDRCRIVKADVTRSRSYTSVWWRDCDVQGAVLLENEELVQSNIEIVHCQTVFGCELPSVLLVTRYDKFIKKLACNPL